MRWTKRRPRNGPCGVVMERNLACRLRVGRPLPVVFAPDHGHTSLGNLSIGVAIRRYMK